MHDAYLEGRQPVALGLAIRRLEFGGPIVTTEALVPLRREAVEADTYVAWFPVVLVSARFRIINHRPDVPLALMI